MKETFIVIGILVVVCAFYWLQDNVISPWRMKRWHERYLRDLHAGKIKPVIHEHTLLHNDEGFAVRNDKAGSTSEQTPWDKIIQVTVFKRDLFSTDQICAFFHLTAETGIEVHEEMNDWRAFIEALPIHLPGCTPTAAWLEAVTLPAFAPNEAIIYTRGTSHPERGAAA